MRSLFARIFLWFVGTSLLSLAAFLATSSFFLPRYGSSGVVAHADRLHLDQASKIYEEGGSRRLAEFLDRLGMRPKTEYHLTDSTGRDLVTGADRRPLLAEAGSFHWPVFPRLGRMVQAQASDDGRYRLIAIIAPPHPVPTFLPLYLWILLGTTILCLVLAINLARTLRRLRGSVEQFGRGDFSVRIRSSRRDEIGDLSRAFDRMAEQIETLLTAERRLLQDVSHELRSPLARLRFAVELARGEGDREEALGHIAKDVERLANLVDELLQLTRAEGDPASQDVRIVPLHELLRTLVADCALEAEAKRRTLVLKADRPAFLMGERELLRRAVENVLRNAIHFAPEGTAIEVGLTVAPHVATVRVRDHGPGIPEEALDDIFRPFFRVNDDRARASGGVGLGLSIAQRAVSLHQGAIRARNMHPGLAVTIELPCLADPPNVS